MTITCATETEKLAVLKAVDNAIANGKAIWGYTQSPGSLKIEVRGFKPVVQDVIRGAR